MSASPATSLLREVPPVALDVDMIRADFPILRERIHGKPLVYLDNAATTHKARAVIEAETHFYYANNSNVHRGVHLLSERATLAYEDARIRVQRFLNAPSAREIIFVRGTTEAINLVAQTFARASLQPGDEILITAMEHHSNIVPWQMVCDERNARLRVAPIDDRGDVVLEEYERLLGPRTRLAAFVHLSNSLGTLNPIARMIQMAHARAVPVLIDGAQAVARMPVDVQALGCDFYTFSGHKVYGPTGIGVLYGKANLLEAMPPYQGGGDMISSVTFERTTYNTLPYKFEAGTPHIAGAVGLAAALDYLTGLGLEQVADHERVLLQHATAALAGVPGLRLIGTPRQRAGVVSFVMEGIHPHDVGTVLDQEGIAVRTGHHCCQPVMDRFGVPATARASLAAYNTRAEIDALVKGLVRVREVFA